jgi:protein-tyrosine phosphatase
MKQALTYLIAAVVQLALALWLHGWALLLLWTAVACLLVGLAYAGAGAALFGKRADGRLAWWAWLLLPYLGFTYAIWKIKRRLSKEALYNEITPGLWIGRRVLGAELPDDVQVIVDLTCEFAEPSTALARCEYRALPTLNYSVPPLGALQALVAELAGRDGVYIHCAQGHGRSATVAAALLRQRGAAATVDEAVAMVVRVRPKVHLEPCQMEVLHQFSR